MTMKTQQVSETALLLTQFCWMKAGDQ